jgi:hypothetical protein
LIIPSRVGTKYVTVLGNGVLRKFWQDGILIGAGCAKWALPLIPVTIILTVSKFGTLLVTPSGGADRPVPFARYFYGHEAELTHPAVSAYPTLLLRGATVQYSLPMVTDVVA